MLDIKFIRENQDLVQAAITKKHVTLDLGALIAADDTRLALLRAVEEMRAKQNEVSAKLPQAGQMEKEDMLGQMKELKTELVAKETELKEVMKTWRALMLAVPNVPDVSVPDGASDADNVEVKKEGDIPNFSFTPKSHIELLALHDMADFERGIKISGFRGYVLKNDAALLSFALWRFAIDLLTKEGFAPMIVPSLVRPESLMGTGYLPGGEEDLYKTQDGDYLAGTAEVATMAYYMDEIIDKEKLPLSFVSFSPCFRREAGSHGKDTKGLYRVHEFFKLEQVVLVPASHEESVAWHEKLTQNAEHMLQALGLPYRVVLNCGGDIGLGQVKKYDIETWIPSENRYGETHSSSYFHDFQTRRLNIRYRDTDGTLRFVHSLNNTMAATPRLLISLLENYQEADGRIRIPKALVPYMGKDIIG
jgi:seryl-tRNA synthetase